MDKQKLFLDFDNCITNSTKRFCEIYSEIYKDHPDFIPPKWELVDKYNFTDQCSLLKMEEIEQIFSMNSFFQSLEFINENTYEVLEQLNEKYQIIICSIGTPMNIALKSLWIHTHLPFIKDYILLVNDQCKMDKSVVDMKNGIFVDDVASNLVSSNSFFKIAYGETHEWNRTWQGKRCLNWNEVAQMLL